LSHGFVTHIRVREVMKDIRECWEI